MARASDFCALARSKLALRSPWAAGRFFDPLGIQLAVDEAECAISLVFRVLQRPSPKPACANASNSRDYKAATWIIAIRRIADSGAAFHMELESVVGRPSFAPTSVFCRFGGGIAAPLYAILLNFRIDILSR